MLYITSQNGIDFIKAFEGLKTKPYLCNAGMPTIGYGHVLSSLSEINEISEEEAEALLREDLKKAESCVRRNISVPILQNQFDALVSFSFNVGAGAFQRSTLRQKINYMALEDEIYKEFMRWIYISGQKLAGLIRRRSLEAKIYLDI